MPCTNDSLILQVKAEALPSLELTEEETAGDTQLTEEETAGDTQLLYQVKADEWNQGRTIRSLSLIKCTEQQTAVMEQTSRLEYDMLLDFVAMADQRQEEPQAQAATGNSESDPESDPGIIFFLFIPLVLLLILQERKNGKIKSEILAIITLES